MIITKEIAKQVTSELLKTRREKCHEIIKIKEDKATKYFIRALPPVVMEAFRMYPNIFNTRGSCQFNAPGIGYQHFSFTESLPDVSINPNLSDEEATELIELEESANILSEEYTKLKQELQISLVNIRTYKNCEKIFPEAFALLPTRTTTTVAINVTDIRKVLFPSA